MKNQYARTHLIVEHNAVASKEAGNYYFAVSSSFIWTFIGQTRSSDGSMITKSKCHEYSVIKIWLEIHHYKHPMSGHSFRFVYSSSRC